MAGRDGGRSLTDLDTDIEDFSLETSVPTDLTMSPDNSRNDRRSKITKQLIERKQVLHDLQLVKIELSQKNLIIENMKAENLQRTEELEERLNDAIHQKQILQARLESQLQIQQDEARRRHDSMKKELEEVSKRQHQLESTNSMLREKAGDVRKGLRDLELSEERYYELKSLNEDEWSLRDYVAVRLYEALKPLQTELDVLRIRCHNAEKEDKASKAQLLTCQQSLEQERREHGELRVKFQKMTMDYADTKQSVKEGDYKVENYDRVKGERERVEHDYLDVQRQFSVIQAAHNNLQKERDDLNRDLSSARQSIALLQQDKDYLNKQANDATNRCEFAEEKFKQLTLQLEKSKEAREEIYEKYVTSRDQYKSEYESKLREELELIRVRTNAEIDRLRTSTKEMYERENRNLREARDMSMSEKERAQQSERDANSRYEQLLTEFRQLQTSNDSTVSDVHSELKLKAFELERTQIVYEETVRNFKESQLEVEKLQRKIEVLTREYYSLQSSQEKRVLELEAGLSESKTRLEGYEKLEQELDEVVMQAAEVENEEDAEKVIFSYGYGANVPSNAKRRLKHSVHLAKRLLQLERQNTMLRSDLEKEKKNLVNMEEELNRANSLLDGVQQPASFIMESMRSKDTQLQKQKAFVGKLEKDVVRLESEKKELNKVKNQMSLDLERLLNQTEELTLMKQVVMSMSGGKLGDYKPYSGAKVKSKPHMFDVQEPHTDKPGITQFTKGNPQWYNKLKQKSALEKNKFSSVYGTGK